MSTPPMNVKPIDYSKATQADIDLFYSRTIDLTPAAVLEQHLILLHNALPPHLHRHFVACWSVRRHNTLTVLDESLRLLQSASPGKIDPVAYCYGLATAMQVARGAALGAVMQALDEAGEQAKLSAVLERCERLEQVQQGWHMHDLLAPSRLDLSLPVCMQAATCCAVSLVCGVVSPEMWPVPPEIWKRHRASLKSYDAWQPAMAWGGV